MLVHGCPWPVQSQLPDAQWKPGQQSESLLQVKALSPHFTQALPLHSSPLQQSGPAVASQPSPAWLHFAAQMPPLHSKPEQQSLSSVQLAPPRPQPEAHTEAPLASLQPSFVQQSLDVTQLSPAALQRAAPHVPESQVPEQQSSAWLQAAPSARQPLSHRPALHVRPEQQVGSPVQGSPNPAHWQVPRQSFEQQAPSYPHSAPLPRHAGAGGGPELQLAASASTRNTSATSGTRRTTATTTPASALCSIPTALPW